MTAIVAAARRMIERHGEAMVLKRTGHPDVTLKGKRVGGGLEELGDNGAVQQQIRVKVSTVELAASAWAVKEPKRTDHIAIGGRDRVVLDAKPLSDGGVVGLYELLVAG